MKITRKDFLRLGGLALFGAAGKKLLSAFPGETSTGDGGPTVVPRRWAMVIDFRKCREDAGCNNCLAACKRAHNIPDIPERAHEVKWIWKERFENVFPFDQTEFTRQAFRGHPLPVLCNHCEEPACTRVCPTKATWKRGDGIVMMDWHRCIGCRYCIAACPYGSRSFNWSDPRAHITQTNPDFPTRTKGVVEKCNFCEERLAKGQPPACVEACKEKALVFGDLNDAASPVRQLLRRRFSIQRRPELGTRPAVYYLI
ncbi:MAG: sulfate reduction electron transfer complex DsrMKJOP subunit DsrO [Terriglobales bacterium]